MFQHRHYKEVAAVIAELPEALRNEVAIRFAWRFKELNPRFDPKRFFSAAHNMPINRKDKVA